MYFIHICDKDLCKYEGLVKTVSWCDVGHQLGDQINMYYLAFQQCLMNMQVKC